MEELYRGYAFEKMLIVSQKYHTGKLPFEDLKLLWEICIDPINSEIKKSFESEEYLLKKDLHKYLKENPLEFLKICDGMGL